MPIIAAYMVPHPPLIIPDVGRGGEKQIEETKIAYERVAEEIAELEPDTIVISSPHATMYADYFHISPGNAATGSFSRFGADKVKFIEEYDTALVSEIEKRAKKTSFPAGTLGEVDRDLDHGTMVPLFFIRKRYKGGKIVRVGLSGLPLTDHYRMGQIIKDSVNATGKRVVYVASGDLSHKLQDYGPYGYAAEGPVYDQKVMDVCQRGAFGELLEFDEDFCDKAAECGHRSFVIMAGALDGVKVRANRLSHQDITGVGYGICTFTPGDEDDSRRFLDIFYREKEREIKEKRQNSDAYVQLAYKSVYSYVLEKKVLPVPSDIPEEMLGIRAGAFVSIHEHGRLRGCIGTIGPTCENVAEEIIQNAISASTKDPRFNAITANELEFLEINVDVLGEPENISSMDELDVKRYGVIVSSGRKRGLLLPDLDGVDSVEQQVAIAMQKGGITEDDEVHLQRFEVVRHY
ncbi:AmmeMemoRadiSam system protein A [Butyrivibrio sp.]|jgi:AmmeMemoRadiSam system protein A|uniref:AmmeMemoRadiSam system protein A n=1 Tax=Butyrivibrio sp. TaxID=28121 RepID=UPI0025BE5114|nr:AmmeMemoRadiSam system protein A [Butyrivibrio sp.]MBE5838968.1 AmmeMemoRadiSam system protein A [Butyrivibrio sp.]